MHQMFDYIPKVLSYRKVRHRAIELKGIGIWKLENQIVSMWSTYLDFKVSTDSDSEGLTSQRSQQSSCLGDLLSGSYSVPTSSHTACIQGPSSDFFWFLKYPYQFTLPERRDLDQVSVAIRLLVEETVTLPGFLSLDKC